MSDVTRLLDAAAAGDGFDGRGHFFAAAALGLRERTAYRSWAYTRAWLRRELDRAG